MTVATALQQGTKLLEDGAVPVPKLTAEVLLSHALKKERIFLFAHPEHELSEVAWIHYGRYLHERIGGKPTQYITKRQEFYGRDFRVTPAVLIPRPETEFVVEEALRWCTPESKVLDVCTGSGAIAVTIALEKQMPVLASDLSGDALLVAKCNAMTLGAQVDFVRMDLLEGIRHGVLDVLTANPPYVAESQREGLQREVRDFEPPLALFGGPEGTEVYSRLIRQAADVLRPGGRLVLELGFNSLPAVRTFAEPFFDDEIVRHDLAGFQRVFSARRKV
ncbi:MAG TPA: peptide chain release factor N(5)-glutamine methyltransferase [Bryobacteraceae bacterium]|nr:peptide chain release factor N(5)-glutamine methyltransferase [Bryobacteraceae bacterium]